MRVYDPPTAVLNPSHFQDRSDTQLLKHSRMGPVIKNGISKNKTTSSSLLADFIPTIRGGRNVKCWNLKIHGQH